MNIEFTAVAKAFEEPSLGIPLLTTTEMSAAIIQSCDLALAVSSDPHAGRGYMKRRIRMNVPDELR